MQERLKTISFLNTFGFSKNDWFVTIHLREDGGGQMRGIRNIKPETYIPAIKYIIERGGWVFKIGSAGIKSKINLKTKKFIDFSSIDFNPFLDIFLISNCRFFIGTGSGPINIASQIFCKPILLTNAGPLLSRVPWPFQLVIPKMYLSNKTNKVMGLSERLNNKIGTLESTNALSELGYSLIDNNHEIIKDACNEMMEITSVNGYKFDILLKNDNQILFRKILNDKKGLCPIYCSSMLLETYPEFLKY